MVLSLLRGVEAGTSPTIPVDWQPIIIDESAQPSLILHPIEERIYG